ncbi:MAG: Eco57I restriction-modification methylase domain-containing protein, partial [Planctomyces sp.]
RNATQVHTEALALLARLHDLPVQDAAERARLYREELLAAPAWRQLKSAMDLWCACWFWPAESLDVAPLPSTLAQPLPETQAEADRIAARLRFFHWELEFPDVFRAAGSGFDAILGNPPWENLQPNPEEFFSNYDPLFRTYGRLVKNDRLRQLFAADVAAEKAWLDYAADFNSMSNWVTNASNCFGDPITSVSNNDRFSLGRGKASDALHSRWRSNRLQSSGFADKAHPFRHQTGRIFTYRLFLEQSYALL